MAQKQKMTVETVLQQFDEDDGIDWENSDDEEDFEDDTVLNDIDVDHLTLAQISDPVCEESMKISTHELDTSNPSTGTTTPMSIPVPSTGTTTPMSIPVPSTGTTTPMSIPVPSTGTTTPPSIPVPSTGTTTPMSIPVPSTGTTTPMSIPVPSTGTTTPPSIPVPSTGTTTPPSIPVPGTGTTTPPSIPVPSTGTTTTTTNNSPFSLPPFTESVGPNVHLDSTSTAMDAFLLIFGEDTFQLLADQTNLYARQLPPGASYK